MSMLINCSVCRTPLQLPPGATTICCADCHATTRVAETRSAPPPYLPTTSSSYNNYYRGQKKAVIIGILYRNAVRTPLRGCVNDANLMKDMLIHSFNFTESKILMLTEGETDPCKIPTKHNILTAMSWLVDGCKLGDSLVFYFSGHGDGQPNDTGDERDNQDETLVPMDSETQGMIVDNEINARIVRPLPAGVKLHAIIDACHSGTMLDLPYLCIMDRSGKYSTWDDHSPKSGAWKGTSGGEVISISGCADNQRSKDITVTNSACFLSLVNTSNKLVTQLKTKQDLTKGMYMGAMTCAFIRAIQNGQSGTYGSILNAMRSTIATLTEPGEKQEPQLTCNHKFDVDIKPFSL